MYDRYAKLEQDITAEKSTFIVASTDGIANVEGWQVAYDTTATGNATELTLAKAASGVAVTNDVFWFESDKTTSIEVDNNSSIPKTGALGKHPSTVTYGWTVTKMNKVDLDTLDTTWTHLRASVVDKPFQIFTIKALPFFISIAETGAATVDATTGGFKAGAKAMMFMSFFTGTMSGEDINEIWVENLEDNRNEITDLTADADNKNERFSNTSLMWSVEETNGIPNSVMRLSQAFVLQTADHTYTNIPKA